LVGSGFFVYTPVGWGFGNEFYGLTGNAIIISKNRYLLPGRLFSCECRGVYAFPANRKKVADFRLADDWIQMNCRRIRVLFAMFEYH
jgi:hypothetical protein